MQPTASVPTHNNVLQLHTPHAPRTHATFALSHAHAAYAHAAHATFAAHIAASTRTGTGVVSNGSLPINELRFIMSSRRAYKRDDLLRLLARQYPEFVIAPPADGATESSPPEAAEGPEVFCSKTIGALGPGVSVRPAPEALLDMAAAMLELNAVEPRLKTAAEL